MKYLTGKLINNGFGNTTGWDGETEGHCDFEFKLKEPVRVVVAGRVYTYDRLNMVIQTWYPLLGYKNGKEGYMAEMPVPIALVREVYDILVKLENGKGALKDWCFSDEVYSMIKGMEKKL